MFKMADPGHDWDSSSDAASPSPSLGSQQSVITANGTKKHINRGRWTKEEVRKLRVIYVKPHHFHCFNLCRTKSYVVLLKFMANDGILSPAIFPIGRMSNANIGGVK